MKHHRSIAGQSLVELALIVPLLLMLLFGIIELGVMLSVYVGMTNSAREAARAGAVYQYTGSVTGLTYSTVDSQRQTYITSAIPTTLNPIINASTLTTNVSYIPSVPADANLYRAGDIVNVELVYNHPLFFGLLGPQQITLRATSAMRIETGGLQ